MEILNERDLQLGLFTELSDHRRDSIQSGRVRRAQSSLTGDELIPLHRLHDEHGLKDPMLPDAGRQGGKFGLVEALARLMRIGADLIDRDLSGSG